MGFWQSLLDLFGLGGRKVGASAHQLTTDISIPTLLSPHRIHFFSTNLMVSLYWCDVCTLIFWPTVLVS